MIIAYNGSPGMTGAEWGELPHTHLLHSSRLCAKTGTPTEWIGGARDQVTEICTSTAVDGPGNHDIANIIDPCQDGAKPCSPYCHRDPAGARNDRKGRFIGWRASAAWNHDQGPINPAVRQAYAMRNISNARSALIQADSNRALVTCSNRNLPGRSHEFRPVGPSVQIALRGKWVGDFRAIGNSSSILILERGRKVTKRPKYKTRMILAQPEDGLGRSLDPGTDEAPSGEETSNDGKRNFRLRHRKSRAQSPSGEPLPAAAEAEMPDNAEEALELAADGEVHDELLAAQHGLSPHRPGRMFPAFTFENQCVIMCPSHPGEAGLASDETYSTFCYPTLQQTLAQNLYTDQDVIGHFDPSRIPPRVAYQVPQARLEIEKEITDLLKSSPGHPPVLIEVALGDPEYRHLARVHIALVVKRKSVDLYKGWLCARGDVAPLTVAGFMSSHTAHRCGIKLLCTISTRLHWRVRALGISQAFLQSENLREEDRLAGLPPPMATLPWTGRLATPRTPVKSLPPNRRGFLMLRPLQGGRDAPMRWRMALPKRLTAHNFRQLKCDVCMFTKHNAQAQLIAFLACHVDDILFTGADDGLKDTEEALRTFRAGETENCQCVKTSFSPVCCSNEEIRHRGKYFCRKTAIPKNFDE